MASSNLLSVGSSEFPNYNSFIISAGGNRSVYDVRPYWSRIALLEYDVVFYDVSYDLGDQDQYDWNKLFGFTWGFVSPETNSIRFAWRWDKDSLKIPISPYLHVNKKRLPEVGEDNPICFLEEKVEYRFVMFDNWNGSWTFKVFRKSDEKLMGEKTIKFDSSVITRIGTFCWPFFGGTDDETGKPAKAPKKIVILMRKSK